MRDANEILVNEGPEKLCEWFDQAPVMEWEETEAGPEAVADGDDLPELRLHTICAREFARLKLPPRAMLLEPILPERGLAMLFAGRGIGKTHVALGIAYAVSTGGDFLRWRADEPRNVLYVDGEMPQQALQDRLRAIMANGGRRPRDGAFRLLCMDRQPLGVSLNLADPKHQKHIDLHLDEVEFLVLDNLSTLVNGGPENDAEFLDFHAGLAAAAAASGNHGSGRASCRPQRKCAGHVQT